MNPTQALKLICDGIIQSLKTNPAGTPEGSLYAVMMAQGCSIVQFRAIITALIDAGMIRKEGNLLFAQPHHQERTKPMSTTETIKLSNKNKILHIRPDGQTLTKAEIAEQNKRKAELEAMQSQPHLESLTITIEWKKNRMWGHNPHATGEAITSEGMRLTGTAKASGCGYCKTSTVIADLFNQFLGYKLFSKLPKKLPYGINLPKNDQKWLPYYAGGIGEGCYRQISEAIGGKWENLAYTDNVQVYRWTANKV